MFCTNCGREAETGANFCASCGIRLAPAHGEGANPVGADTIAAPGATASEPFPLTFEQTFGLPAGMLQAMKRASEGPVDTEYVREMAANADELSAELREFLAPYARALAALQHWARRRWDGGRSMNRKNIETDWHGWLAHGAEFLWACPPVPVDSRDEMTYKYRALNAWLEDDFVFHSVLHGNLKLTKDDQFMARQHLGDRWSSILGRVLEITRGAERARSS